MRVADNKVGAVDLDKVVMVSNNLENKIDSHFSRSELLYQERDVDVRFVDWTLKSVSWKSGKWFIASGLENLTCLQVFRGFKSHLFRYNFLIFNVFVTV